MNQQTLIEIFNTLSQTNGVFYSEGDFKIAFGCALRDHFVEKAVVRAEVSILPFENPPTDPRLQLILVAKKIPRKSARKPPESTTKIVDFWINENAGKATFIELKYYLRLSQTWNLVKPIVINNKAAFLFNKFDYWYDVWKLEHIIFSDELNVDGKSKGFAICLTNDPSIWEGESGNIDRSTAVKSFEFNEKRMNVEGKLLWHKPPNRADFDDAKKRAHILTIKGPYDCTKIWKEYPINPEPSLGEYQKFRIAILEISR